MYKQPSWKVSSILFLVVKVKDADTDGEDGKMIMDVMMKTHNQEVRLRRSRYSESGFSRRGRNVVETFWYCGTRRLLPRLDKLDPILRSKSRL